MNLTKDQERKLQLVQLIGLLEINRICDKYNIPYILMFGTLLGAVRHKGFIPWDDDIDIAMTRENYNKFQDVCKSELSSDFFIQYHDTDKNYVLPIMRLKVNGTTCVEDAFKDLDIHNGVSVDIYPCDNVPQKHVKYITYKFLTSYLEITTSTICNYRAPCPRKTYSILERILILSLTLPMRIFSTDELIQIRDSHLCRYQNQATEKVYCTTNTGRYSTKKEWSSSILSERINMEFEGNMLPIPKDYKGVLSKIYGDYMQLPPKEEQCQHHGFIEVSLGKYESMDVIKSTIENYRKINLTSKNIQKL